MKCSLGISNFLEEISSLSHAVVFLYFFALITKVYLSLLAILWNSAFKWVYLSFSLLFFSQLFVRPQTTVLPFCISFPSSIQINLQKPTLSHPKVCLPHCRESQKVSHLAGSESVFSEPLLCPSCQVHFHTVCAKLHSLCQSLSHSRDHLCQM